MKIEELKAIAEKASNPSSIGLRAALDAKIAFSVEITPARVLKLLAVVEAAKTLSNRATFHPKEHPSLFPAHEALKDALRELEDDHG